MQKLFERPSGSDLVTHAMTVSWVPAAHGTWSLLSLPRARRGKDQLSKVALHASCSPDCNTTHLQVHISAERGSMLHTRTHRVSCQAAAQQQQALAAPRPVACHHAAAGRVNLAPRLAPVRCPHAPTQSRSKILLPKIAAAVANAPVASLNGKEQQNRPLRCATWAPQQLHALLGYLLPLACRASNRPR